MFTLCCITSTAFPNLFIETAFGHHFITSISVFVGQTYEEMSVRQLQ